MPFDLFISHSSKDKTKTRKIHDRLTTAGIETWVDFIDIHDGDVWDNKIQEALNSAKRAVIVLSRSSLNSTHCKGEWQRFITRKLPIFILKIEALTDDEILYYLMPTQITDLTRDFETRLAAWIAELTGTPATTPPPSGSGKISGGFPAWHLHIPMHGRESDLGKVRAALDGAKPPHVVQITGIGGVGKSRLAADVVQLADYTDGVIWHDCRIASLSTLAATIREHLGLSAMTDNATWDELDKHDLLVVLDNGEDCPEPAAYSEVINRLHQQARVIVTSRMRWLDLRAPEQSLTQPDKVAATQIMVDFAAQKASGRDLKGLAEVLAEAAHRHPRLMELAAELLKDMPVESVLKELKALKSQEAQDALNEMIVRSVERVRSSANGETAIAVLRKLAVCRGGFTEEAAKAIAGEEDFGKVLRLLRNWGLLRFEEERYEIDPLVIETVGEDEAAHRAHLDYYEAVARQHDEKQDYLGLDRESANLEAAFEWAVGAGDAELAYWFVNACINFQANRGRYSQRMNWISRVEPLITEQSTVRLRAAFAVSRGSIYQEHPVGNRQENLKRAIAAYEQALRFWTPETAPHYYAMTQNNLGNAYRDLAGVEDRAGNVRRAIAAYEQALRFWTPETAPHYYAMTQNNLGNAYRDLAEVEDRAGNVRRAIAAYEQALRFRTPETAPLQYATTQNNLGNAYRDLAEVEDRAGNVRRAIAAFEQALRFRTPETAPHDYAGTQRNLGIAQEDSGDIRAAIRCWCEAAKYYRLMDASEEADEMARWVTEAGGKCE